MPSFLLTLDYELFGNGTGDVFKHIIEPTDKLLAIVDKYNVKFTIFFEVIEYWKLKEEWDKGNSMGYPKNPIKAMEQQICAAYRNGHDIQLHLHPQWIDAYWENNKWFVNFDKWRLGGLNDKGDNSLSSLIRRGKQTLEDILQPIDPDYKCIAMRAGGYNIQPSYKIVGAMKETGIIIDSSIYPGGKETGILSNYDYTNIDPSLGMWHIDKQLEKQGNSSIIELPIVAFPIIRFKKYLSWERVRGILNNRQSAKESLEAKTSTSEKKSNWLDKICYFFQTEWQTWDYCLFSPALHKSFLKQISKLNRDFFVLVGHPKSFSSSRGLEYLLKQIQQNYQSCTLKDLPLPKI